MAKSKTIDRDDLFDALEAAKGYLEDAVAELNGIDEYSGTCDDILETANIIGEAMDEISAEREREYAEMIRDMTRDYWKAVL